MTDAELAILSIITEAPIAGYDVQGVIEERNLRMWTMVGVESTYYIIQKLEKQGLITSVDADPPEDVKARMYRSTPAGVGVLQTAITDLLSSPRYLPQGLDIGLANIPVLRTEQVYNSLVTYRAGLYSRLEAVQTRLDALQSDDALPFHIFSMFDHQIAMLQAEIEWFDAWFPQWEALAPVVEQATEDAPPSPIPRMHQVILPHEPDSVHKSPTRQAGSNHDTEIEHAAHDPHHTDLQDDPPGGGVEFPPPPQRRSRDDKTRMNQDTPPQLDNNSET